ncbi:MAG: oxidoreductase [Deltaproteobacteria bacterium]|nr:oxidoreductase [Deltaproteobacteria bacterium]
MARLRKDFTVPLLKNGKITEDAFTRVTGETDFPSTGALIVDLTSWQEHRSELLGRADPIGIELAAGESPSEIADDLGNLSLVALDFPAFSDGRAFSSARLLRERYHFKGEVRAVGDVLLEQLHFMSRVGFDSFVLDSEDPVQEWLIAQDDLNLWYQPTEDGRITVRQKRRG